MKDNQVLAFVAILIAVIAVTVSFMTACEAISVTGVPQCLPGVTQPCIVR